MFDYLNKLLKKKQDYSSSTEMALKGSAKMDALLDISHRYNGDVHESRSGQASGLESLALDGIQHANVIQAIGVYARYPDVQYDVQGINRRHTDRDVISYLRQGSNDQTHTILQWVKSLWYRDDIQSMYTDDLSHIMDAVKIAAAARSADEAIRTYEEKCKPILERLIPDAFVCPVAKLKQKAAEHVLGNALHPKTKSEDHVVLCARSSIFMTKAIIDTLVGKDAKVILPTPHFDPFPVFIDYAGAKIITADTTKTGFKLRAADLKKIIKENGMGKNDWLMLPIPNNATLTSYTPKELQDIADVVVSTGIRVIADELYARMNAQQHVSLASIKSSKGKSLHDQVVTVSGCSKQYPNLRENRKLGVACFSNSEDAKKVEEYIRNLHEVEKQGVKVDNYNAEIFSHVVAHKPADLRIGCLKHSQSAAETVNNIVKNLNSRFQDKSTKEVPFELIAGEGSYLGCLKMNSAWCKKVGITSSDDLTDYLFATTKIFTRSLLSEGVKDPIVRINFNDVQDDSRDFASRLDKLLTAIEHDKAPRMTDVRKSIDSLIHRESQKGTVIADMANAAMRSI